MPPHSTPIPDPQDTPLFDLVFQRIEKSPGDSISFAEFMELALYDPESGYYARPEHRNIGRRGDFFTSVSVGDTYGFLLAHRIAKDWRERLEAEPPLVIVEQGGHDGQLALDVIAALEKIAPDAAAAADYRLVEPRPESRRHLEGRFAKEGKSHAIHVFASLFEASAPQGFFLCNELLDAFPVHRLVLEDGRWQEHRVGVAKGSGGRCLAWTTRPLGAELRVYGEILAATGLDFPEGYATEVCPSAETWMEEAAGLFERGLWWIVDYGYEAEEYFAPHRRTGTLRCYRGHRAGEDPFSFLGETDITAHVNFTFLREAAERAGLTWRQRTDQHHFLIEAAKPWLLALDGIVPGAEEMRRIRQFQTLTHPGMMGQQFKVAELSRGIE